MECGLPFHSHEGSNRCIFRSSSYPKIHCTLVVVEFAFKYRSGALWHRGKKKNSPTTRPSHLTTLCSAFVSRKAQPPIWDTMTQAEMLKDEEMYMKALFMLCLVSLAKFRPHPWLSSRSHRDSRSTLTHRCHKLKWNKSLGQNIDANIWDNGSAQWRNESDFNPFTWVKIVSYSFKPAFTDTEIQSSDYRSILGGFHSLKKPKWQCC